jgi:hypothetical protein
VGWLACGPVQNSGDGKMTAMDALLTGFNSRFVIYTDWYRVGTNHHWTGQL